MSFKITLYLYVLIILLCFIIMQCGITDKEVNSAPKIISGPKATQIDSIGSKVEIQWETDKMSNSTVFYGFSRSSGYDFTKRSDDIVTTHNIILDSLFQGQIYYYTVESTDQEGLATRSLLPSSFNTVEKIPPCIIMAPVIEDWVTGIHIAWETNEPSRGVLYYGLTVNYTDSIQSQSAFTLEKKHQVHIFNSKLMDDRLYHFRIKSTDKGGNLGFSNDGVFASGLSVTRAMNLGWEEFRHQNYLQAIKYFDYASRKKYGYTDADKEIWHALGWCYLHINDYVKAKYRFDRCLVNDSTFINAKAGLAFLLQIQSDYAGSVSVSKSLLAQKGNWVFSYDDRITYADIQLSMAQCYFALADFASSLRMVGLLNPAFSADINTQQGILSLALEIERLRTII